MAQVTILYDTCKGMEDCGICAFVCPKALFYPSKKINEAGYLPPKPPDEEVCTGCENCMISCPDFAIVVKSDEQASETENDE